MQKQVVRFERSTTVKDDVCYTGYKFHLITEGVSCNDCRVHILTDRFINQDFQKKIMQDNRPYPLGTYPYVLIVDTAGCNLRCRGCYSWKYWKPEPSVSPVNVDEKTLAKHFRCKIEKINDGSLVQGFQ